MARIRSVHPGLFTDETFMSLSMAARVLIIGIWTEADDNGVFEWKPITLKARLLPADNVSVADLLGELKAYNFVNQFTLGDRSYGVIRNFRKYQRPKKPKERYLLPDELRSYVGLDDDSGEPRENQDDPEGEIPPQMEEGGGRREDEGVSSLRSESRARGVKIREGWTPTDAGMSYARFQEFSDREISRLLEKFKLNAKQNDRRCADWDAAWQVWVIGAVERAGRPLKVDGEQPIKSGCFVKPDTKPFEEWTKYRGGKPPIIGKTGAAWVPSEYPPLVPHAIP